MIKTAFLVTVSLFMCGQGACQTDGCPGGTGIEYIQLKSAIARGWNTWNTNSVLSYVLLPEAIAVDFSLKDRAGNILKNALMGQQGKDAPVVELLAHSSDGSYTELNIGWNGVGLKIQSCAHNKEVCFLLTPLSNNAGAEVLIHPEKIWWKREGTVSTAGNRLIFDLPSGKIVLGANGVRLPDATEDAPQIAFSAASEMALSTHPETAPDSVKSEIEHAKMHYEKGKLAYPKSQEVYEALQNVLAWDMIYDPRRERVLTTVSRSWNVDRGGFVLFCWDTFFAAYMHSLYDKRLAYADAIEITNTITPSGFVPNLSASMGVASYDRSQPPVGSFVVREIYRHYREKWFLRELFPKLLTWNRWWPQNRDHGGFLCWGSTPFEPYRRALDKNAHTAFGAALESGLDNSPMYENVPFDTASDQLELADVGLMSLYVLDCQALADIATVLRHYRVRDELMARASKYRHNLGKLWNNEKGIYLNLRLDSHQFSSRISPTNFYPLLIRAPTRQQAARMIKEHFYNPNEFWGRYIMPSISFNDPGYNNDYWRGRIWGPMNFLVYLGLRNYDFPMARQALVEKSRKLFLSQWEKHHYICENYNAETGACDDVRNCDLFYHWGALLGFIDLMEKGCLPPPEAPLETHKGKK